MNNLLFLLSLTIIANKVESHVLNTNVSAEYITDDDSDQNQSVNNETINDVPTDTNNTENRNYLDDVIFTLKNENWTIGEEGCKNQIFKLLNSLQNFTLWAVWDWDTQSSEPQGLLFGNRYQLGNFDQCMNAPWSDRHKELRMKYCLADIVLERSVKNSRSLSKDHFSPYQSALDFMEYHPPHARPLNELTWGVCVPEACGSQTVGRLLEIMLARSHLGVAGMTADIKVTETCQKYEDHKDFDTLFFAFFGIIGLLVVICLFCTYINRQREGLAAEKRRYKVIEAFCLKENAKALLRVQSDGLEILYGIRYFTICLIVLDHQLGIYNSGPISDGYTSDQRIKSTLGHLVLHDDLFVDTFFFLSGFLTLISIVKFTKFPNPLILIIKRYVRLVVALAVILFYICAVFPYTGSGPLWRRAVSHETNQCYENWWLNILMVNNYINTENICFVISWYIPCDFHFFILTILLFWLYEHAPRLGMTCFITVAIASVILPGVVNYVNHLSAVQLFTFEFVVNPRGSKEFHLTYIKSHTRFAAYVVGVFTGFVYTKYKANKNLSNICKKWAILGMVLALTLMLIVMVTGSAFLWRDYHPIEGAIYAALNRPAWALGVALFVICCSFGNVYIVKDFLSWRPWVPLSRLSYGLYLTHCIIITRNVFVTRNPQHNDYFEILNATIGVIFWGTTAALVLWLLAEAPANKLVALMMKSRISNSLSDESNNKPHVSSNIIVSNGNYLSKM